MRLTIDKTSPIPRYAQLKRILRSRIEQGAYAVGSRIPAERQLAEEFDVSRITATRAVRDLVLEGMLQREQGRGTFVCDRVSTASMNIAFVVRELSGSPSSFYLEMLRGIEEVTSCEGYSLIFTSISADTTGAAAPLTLASGQRVDGMLLTELWDEAFLGQVTAANIPAVLLDWESESGNADAVVVHDRQATLAAVSYLIELGHERIAFINGRKRIPTYIDRHAGYREALERAGIAYEDQLVSWGGSWTEDGLSALKPLFARKPTAVACAGDGLALDAIEFIRQSGMNVPQEISVVGLGGSFSRPWPRRFLTTVRIDWTDMGRRAARRLVSRLRGDTSPAQVTRLDGTLVQRMSCAPPPRKS